MVNTVAPVSFSLEQLARMPRGQVRHNFGKDDGIEFRSHVEAMEQVERRRLTETELRAARAMASEHASYGSTRPYLGELPTRGANHVATTGDEAAAAVIGVREDGSVRVAAYSSESHNHPSAVEPYSGAGTGVGGDLRDRTALTGTKPHVQFEARRQGHPLHNPWNDPIAHHTRGASRGIGDYSNATGVVHGDGSIKFHPRFAGNHLVNVAGLTYADGNRLLKNQLISDYPAEEFFGVYIGKAADTTGLGGSEFASKGLDLEQIDYNEKAVQDPDPHLQEVEMRGMEMIVNQAHREGWLDRIFAKDMGAVGLLCSSLEQHKSGKTGVQINGDRVPANRHYTADELTRSETQERFFMYVHESVVDKVLAIINDDLGLGYVNEGACARIVGQANSSGRYVFVRDEVVEIDLPAVALMEGPLIHREVRAPKREKKPLVLNVTAQEAAEALVASFNFKSDEPIYDHYDQDVTSITQVRRSEGPVALTVDPELKRIGTAMVFDADSLYGLQDPAFQAEDSFVRAAYKLALVGCSVIGVTNNANYGRMHVPEEMWEFVQGQKGVARACTNWELAADYLDEIVQNPATRKRLENDPRVHVTVNSGNVSANKWNQNTGTAIPPTTILGVLGWTSSPALGVRWEYARHDGLVYLVGGRQAALGLTDLAQQLNGFDCTDGDLHTIDYAQSQQEVNAIIDVVRLGIALSGNAIEEGGLLNAAAELVAQAPGQMTMDLDLRPDIGAENLTPLQKLGSQSYGVLLHVSRSYASLFESMMQDRGVRAFKIGTLLDSGDTAGLRMDFGSEKVTLERKVIRDQYFGKLEGALGVL